MERWIGRVALVTGANSGMGAGYTKALAEAGMKVVGADVNIDKIESLSKDFSGRKGSVVAVKCDLTVDEDVYNLFKTIKDKLGGVDICINNAGFSHDQDLLNGTPDQWRRMFTVNVIAPCLCTKLSIESMRERGVDDGHIINLCSVRGHAFLPPSRYNFYNGTKHAIKAISEGLRQELRSAKSHIRATSLSPGLVRTGFATTMYQTDPSIAKSYYDVMIPLETEDMSNALIHIISSPPHVEVNEMIIRPTEEDY